jgi:hypothetical protein
MMYVCKEGKKRPEVSSFSTMKQVVICELLHRTATNRHFQVSLAGFNTAVRNQRFSQGWLQRQWLASSILATRLKRTIPNRVASRRYAFQFGRYEVVPLQYSSGNLIAIWW